MVSTHPPFRLALVALVYLGLAGGAGALEVHILSPAAEPTFGRAEVVVEIGPTGEAEATVETVEVLLDGRLVERLDKPPYRLEVDFGQENVAHQLLARAIAGGRILGEATRVIPAIKVDEVIDLDLQQLYVTVTRGGAHAPNLQKKEFRITDRGKPQDIVTFETGNIPFTAVLLFDASGSMRGRNLRLALQGAHTFLNGLRKHDEASLMTFADRLLSQTPFGNTDNLFEEPLRQAKASDGTALLDHLYLALLRLEQRQGRRVLILLSDGWDLHSVIRPEQLRRLARLSQTIIYWIRPAENAPEGMHYLPPLSAWRSPQAGLRQRAKLGGIIKSSGGRTTTIESMGDVNLRLREILQELRQQYALGYYPDPTLNDGSWREVRIKLLSPGLQARTRDGYVDR